MKLEGDRGHLLQQKDKNVELRMAVLCLCPAMLKRVCMCVRELCSSPQDSDNRMHMCVLACEVQYIRPYLCLFLPLRIHCDSTLPSKLPSVARYDCSRHFSRNSLAKEKI